MLTTAEVAAVLERHRNTVRNWRHSEGAVSPPWSKIGGRFLYPVYGLADYIEQNGIADDGRVYINEKLETTKESK